jgi:release factor glutamine methyltransferase
VTVTDLYLGRDAPVLGRVAERFRAGIAARARGIPLQYVLGEAEFFGARFAVGPGVFIPRPETEAVLERVIGALRGMAARRRAPLRLLDLGTGSGCIAATLARELSPCLVVGVELSWGPLLTARRNVRRLGLDGVVRLVQGRWTEPLGGAFDGIVSNPPYVPSDDVDRLPRDVRQEPRVSLDGGPDGLRALGQLLAEAPRLVRSGGMLALECGETQAAWLEDRAAREAWAAEVELVADLAGRPRGVLVTRR